MLVIEPSKSGVVVHVFWCIGKVEGRTGTCSVAVMFEVQLASSNECLPTVPCFMLLLLTAESDMYVSVRM